MTDLTRTDFWWAVAVMVVLALISVVPQ